MNKLLVLVVLAALCILCTNQVSAEDPEITSSDDLQTNSDSVIDIQRAERLIDLGNFYGLLSYSNEILRDNPDDIDALFYRGIAWWELEQYLPAIESLDKVIGIDPNHSEAYYYKSRSYYEKDDYSQALIAIKEAIKINSEDHRYFNRQGKIFFQMDNYNEALSSFERALEIKPDSETALEWKLDTLNELGLLHYDKYEYDEAEKYFDLILETDSEFAYAWNNKGIVESARGNHELAIEYYDKSLSIDPDDPMVIENKMMELEEIEKKNLPTPPRSDQNSPVVPSEPNSNPLANWADLIVELGIYGAIGGGSVLVAYVKKRKKRSKTGRIDSSPIMGKQSLCTDPRCEKNRQGLSHPKHYQYYEENLKTIPLEQGEHFVTINHNSNRIYVSNNKSNVILEIDGLSNKVINKIDLERPRNLAINHETNILYVITGDAGIKKRGTGKEITVIDTISEKIVKTIGKNEGFGEIAINADTNMIYVTKPKSNEITVLDGHSNQIINHIQVHKHPRSVGINPVTDKLYVGFEGKIKFKIAIVDLIKNEMIGTISLRKLSRLPKEIHVNPHTNRIYVPLQNKTDSNSPKLTEIKVIDGTTDTILGDIKRKVSGINSMAINRKTKKIFLTDAGEGDLHILDEDGNLEKTIVGLEGMIEPKVGINRMTNTVYVTANEKMYVLQR